MRTNRSQPKAYILAIMFMTCCFANAQTKKFDTISNKTIATSYITDVVNNKDLSLVNKLYSTEYIFHGMDGIEHHTIQDSSLISFLNYLFKAFPDLHYSIDNAIAENDIVALNLTAKATHKGEFLGYAASNKQIVFKEMFFFRILDGKIIEGWGVVDLDGVKTQISKQ